MHDSGKLASGEAVAPDEDEAPTALPSPSTDRAIDFEEGASRNGRHLLNIFEKHILEPWRHLDAHEVAGAFGDLGVFVPLSVAMVHSIGLDLGTTLVATGIYNIYSGAAFRVPMPVQPMKNIAAVAITEAITLNQALLAGFIVGLALLLLSLLGGVSLAQRAVPSHVVRGVQLGLGIKLAAHGIAMLLFQDSSGAPYREWLGASGLLVGTLAAVYVAMNALGVEAAPGAHALGDPVQPSPRPLSDVPPFAQQGGPGAAEERLLPGAAGPAGWLAAGKRAAQAARAALRTPAALVVVAAGVLITLACSPEARASLSLGPSVPKILRARASDWLPAVGRAALPQLPLTLLNSVVAVTTLSQELFPAVPVSPTRIATSVSLMNLVGPWFGAMPACHGSGGLAAQARFGARTGAAPMLLGAVKLALGLLAGSSLVSLFGHFPEPLLGVLLAAAGAELASTARKLVGGKREWLLMMLTAGGCFAHNTATGFFGGLALSVLTCNWQAQRETCRRLLLTNRDDLLPTQ